MDDWASEIITVPRVNPVILTRPNESITGMLCLTAHHLIFSGDQDEFWVTYMNMANVDKRFTSSLNAHTIVIRCKDFRILTLHLNKEEEANAVAQALVLLSYPDKLQRLYPFKYHHAERITPENNGWLVYDFAAEYKRQGVSDAWRETEVNGEHGVCSSYPRRLFIPKSVSDEVVTNGASFRAENRFPVLYYYHRSNGGSIVGAAQPSQVSTLRRSQQDESTLNALLQTNAKGRAYIFDARPSSAVKKGGTPANLATTIKKVGRIVTDAEGVSGYSKLKRNFMALEPALSLRECLDKFTEACHETKSSNFLGKVEASGWLSAVRQCIVNAKHVAKLVHVSGASVLIHDQSGWDYVPLIASLAQIMLDPFFRTITGFQVLIEKDWVSLGHPFGARFATYGDASSKTRLTSPVFIAFLDSVWQIWHQYPLSFEFNELYLMRLFDHACASQFGTFLCNNEQERDMVDLRKQTVSLWTLLNRPDERDQCTNLLYERNNSVLSPSANPQSLELWVQLYCRWEVSWKGIDHAHNIVRQLKDLESALTRETEAMRALVIDKETPSSDGAT